MSKSRHHLWRHTTCNAPSIMFSTLTLRSSVYDYLHPGLASGVECQGVLVAAQPADSRNCSDDPAAVVGRKP